MKSLMLCLTMLLMSANSPSGGNLFGVKPFPLEAAKAT